MSIPFVPTVPRVLLLALLGALLLAPAPAGALDRTVKAGIDRAYPPHQFAGPDGRPAGFDVDLLRAVAREAGLRVEMELAPWPELRGDLEAGRLDVNPGVFRTPAREARLDFSIPTARVFHAIFVRTDSGVEHVDDLDGATILVNRAGYHDDLLETAGIPVRVVPTADPEEALQRLAAGEADAAIVLNTQGLYYLRENGIGNVRSLPDPLRELELRFAVPEGDADLLHALNDGLLAVRASGEYDALYDRWFGVIRDDGVPVETVLALLGAALLALLVVGGGSALWSRSLQREVQRRSRQLLESDARLRATLAAARDVGFVVAEAPGDDARVLEFSEGAERLFGVSRSQVLGGPVGRLRSDTDRRRHGRSLGSLDADGRRTREAELLRGDGGAFPAFVMTTRLPPADEGGADRLLYVVIDQTERVRAQEAEHALAERLRRSEKMEALGRMAGAVAHDFNNLLTSLLGHVHLAREAVAEDAEGRKHLDRVEEAGRAAGELVGQLLDFARARPVTPRRITWNEPLAGLDAMLRGMLPARIRLEMRLGDEPWPFLLDPSQAQQVVLNLVLNARDAIAGEGRIRVRTRNEVVDGRPMAVLAVSDDGAGMDADTRARAFEPFFTTREGVGTGLGLATVHSIVEACRGRIEVESEPGRGTTFRVAVPRAEGREPEGDAGAAPGTGPPLRRAAGA